MAKRFTDTEKWKKQHFKNLSAPYKLVWLYLLDDCNYAGVWEVEFDVMKLRTGINSSEQEILNVFSDKIKVFDEGKKWFIKDFIDFQYGELNDKNRAHLSVLNLLSSYKNKGLASPLQGAKEKEKDKDKDKDKEVDFDFILKNYHSHCEKLPRVIGLSNERKKHISARLKEFDLNTIISVFEKAGKSNFLTGENDKSWKANFDWIFNPTNFLKILEGKYDNNVQNKKNILELKN